MAVVSLFGFALAKSASAFGWYNYGYGDPPAQPVYGSLSGTYDVPVWQVDIPSSDNEAFWTFFSGGGFGDDTVDAGAGFTVAYDWGYSGGWDYGLPGLFDHGSWTRCGSPIPEPNAALLFCLGFAVAGTATRKRRTP